MGALEIEPRFFSKSNKNSQTLCHLFNRSHFSQFMLLTVSVAVHRSIQEHTLSNSTQHEVHKQVQSVAMTEMKMYLENKTF